jgi:Flp pilus assembly protein TadG
MLAIRPQLEEVVMTPPDSLPLNRRNISAPSSGVHRRSFGDSGVSAVEFALIAPVLLSIVLGLCQFGLTLSNYVTLTGATQAGALLFGISRGAATPQTGTVNQIETSAPNLTPGQLTVTLSVNGTACTTDAACATALSAGAGKPAAVTASYPCNLVVMGINFSPTCTLTVNTTEIVQ